MPDGSVAYTSTIVEGPTSYPDGTFFVQFTDHWYWNVGPTFVPSQWLNAEVRPVECPYVPGTGPWYRVGATGGSCPPPPVGWSGDFAMSARAIASSRAAMGNDELRPVPTFTSGIVGASGVPRSDVVVSNRVVGYTTPKPVTAVETTRTSPLVEYVGQPAPNLMALPDPAGTSPTFDGPVVMAPPLNVLHTVATQPPVTPLTDAVGENPLTPNVVVDDGFRGPPVPATASGVPGIAILAGVGLLAFLAGKRGR